LMALLDSDLLYGQVFNVGSTRETTILDLAHRAREITRSRSEIALIPYDQAYEQGFEDVARRVPDISRIRQAIGWEPARSLTAILEDAIAYATKS
jgi:UDP-glucose 4-epimerase